MIIYPAIDLQNGKVVRLYKGDLTSATIYNDNPTDQAKIFAEEGFEWLHVVDLDGAESGSSQNTKAIADIRAATDLPIQLGGGIRSIDHIKHWLDAGITRVILGTVALRNPDVVIEACKIFPNQIVVGIDARKGMVAVEGWVEESDISALELAKKFEDAGVVAIIYTDINRDGTGEGLNMASTIELAQNISIPVIASGGVGSMDDLRAVKAASDQGVNGVIVGKAYYEGKIDPKDALELSRS
ncbi:MAG: 1-(5-phosphoribosyl)-5-[(5-phosphoribosylamino)methylideneamino]imidazole-4-carboxamide isomerase [Pseudomonadota bacterium]